MPEVSGKSERRAAAWVPLLGLRSLLGPLCGLALLCVVIWRAGDVDWDAVAHSLGRVGPLSVLAAVGLTGLSYLAAGQYDALVHRHLQLPYPARIARRAGMAALAISQTVGLGLVTGTLVRARLLPAIPLGKVTQVTLLVASGFTLSWLILSVTGILAFRGDWPMGIGFLAMAALVIWRLRQNFPDKTPDLVTFAGMFICTGLDCLMAGLALMVLCGDLGMASPAIFLLAFLLAFGSGLISGTPAGLGAFEVVFLATFSPQNEAAILAGIILWRFVYFVGPAILGGIYGMIADSGSVLADIDVELASVGPTARAETAIGVQAQHRAIGLAHGAAWLAARPGRLLIGMFDPSSRKDGASALVELARRAKAEARIPAAYKVDRRMALAARIKGWRVMEVAREALIDPCDFNLDLPARAGLRRKLRRAAAAGVVIGMAKAGRDRDWQALTQVAEVWAASHGGERGFSMGRVQRRHLQRQIVVTARHGDEITAFASFHRNEAEWVLDILRHRDKIDDGTMHALIMGAIDLASQAGCIRLSLAAAPVTGFHDCPKFQSRILTGLGYQSGAGLAQFKQAFAPRWEKRYLIAPSPLALVEALAVITTEVHRPRNSDLLHEDDEEIGIAPADTTCDTPLIQFDEVEHDDAIPVPERAFKAA